MTRRLDVSTKPDYAAYLRGLSVVDLRFLMRRHCPGVEQPESIAAVVDLLTSKEAAAMALAGAERDVLTALITLKALEGTACVQDLVDVSFFASSKETAIHDFDAANDDERRQATEAEVRALYERAERDGLVFQQPQGVFHIPPHLMELVPSESTMATPTHFLVDLAPYDVVLARMINLGLLTSDELTGEAPDKKQELPKDFLNQRVREFVCSPRRVRALVDTAPADIRKQIQYFAKEAIFLHRYDWSPSRERAVKWAEDHLLAVTFDPSVVLEEQSSRPSERDNASMCSAVALASERTSVVHPSTACATAATVGAQSGGNR